MEPVVIASHIVNDNFFEYVRNNLDCNDCTRLLLRSEHVDFDKGFAIQQIECRKRFNSKLPELLSNLRFLFPQKISGEQCSHQDVAKLHADLFSASDNVLDMTMGLGVDSFYISRKVNSVIGIELNEEIAEISKFNYSEMAPNLRVINANSVDYIRNCRNRYSAVFIDPARRDISGKRTYGFHDCTPDVIDLLTDIKKITHRLVIKASPMLDISQSIKELRHIKDIWVIAIKNSCKELLFDLDLSQESDEIGITIHTINFDTTIQRFDIPLSSICQNAPVKTYPTIESNRFLLEPNASIMKSGMTNYLYEEFGEIAKIDVCSHLFIADHYIKGFPGRQFVIEQVIPFKDKYLKPLKSLKTLNVSTRNFRLTAEQLKARLGVKDGGEKYLFGTTTHNGQMVLILCRKAPEQ